MQNFNSNFLNYIEYGKIFSQKHNIFKNTFQESFKYDIEPFGLNAGRSGEFLYVSGKDDFKDEKALYVLKTIDADEGKTMIGMLNDYEEHLEQNRESVLVTYIGYFEFKVGLFSGCWILNI